MLQSALTQQQSPPLTRVHTRNVDREDQFDSGLWNLVIRCTELKVMTIALACLSISYLNNEVTCCLLYLLEHDLDEKNPVDYGPANTEDDEARVFHHQG